jgi:multiple sugar transport system permease protein/N,N'-diacetylchitobiose transport system permease protein
MPKKDSPVKKVIIYSLVIFIAIYSFFPIYWMFISSFRAYRALFSSTSLIPGPFSLKSYENLLGMTKYLINFKNSLWVAFVTTGITLICSILMSYVITRYRMRGKQIILHSMLFTYMFPPLLLAVPLYFIFTKLRLTDSLWGLIISHTTITLPLGVWLLWGFFKAMPFELEEAAMVDGASRIKAFFLVVLPLSLPGILTVSIFSFLLSWTDYTFGLIILSSDIQKTLPIGLATMLGAGDLNWGEIMAGAFLISVPLLIMLVFLSKYFVKGLTAGAIKG